MNLIINTSNLYVGGGLQVAVSFISELKKIDSENEYHVFLSQAVSNEIDKEKYPNNFHFYLIQNSPSSLKNRKNIVQRLKELEKEITPDIVFSVFGPTFWTPRTVHIMGFALPWLINPNSAAFGQLPLFKRIKKRLEILYKAYYVKRNADYYVTETKDTKERLSRFYNIPEENIFVVGNTCSTYFDGFNHKVVNLPHKDESEFRLVTVSHNYPHKNLKVIKDVIPYLKNHPIRYKFVLTIDKDSYNDLFSDVSDYVINLGPISSDLCPSAYKQCDALFLPTLLECFTASYPEAMKSQKPILTSNLPFAHSLCQDSALYFDPLNPKDIADKIIELSTNKSLQKDLVIKGSKRLEHFETAESRARKYLEICEKIYRKENKHERK